MKSMNNTTREIKSQALLDEFAEILGFVQTAYQEGGTAYDVEIGLWRRILELGRQVYGAWLELFVMAMQEIESSWTMAARCAGSMPCIGVTFKTCSVCSK